MIIMGLSKRKTLTADSGPVKGRAIKVKIARSYMIKTLKVIRTILTMNANLKGMEKDVKTPKIKGTTLEEFIMPHILIGVSMFRKKK